MGAVVFAAHLAGEFDGGNIASERADLGGDFGEGGGVVLLLGQEIELFEIVAFALGLFPRLVDALRLLDFTEDLLRRVGIVPEIAFRRFRFKGGYFGLECIDVKDTSAGYRCGSPVP
jgi:hypothetical protein